VTSAADSLPGDAEALPWYHTIDLGGGVVTKGFVDTRSAASRLPFPPSLEGRRCLDVGTQNGFWAFEMERRGAAEVIGIDLADKAERDFPGGPGADQPQGQDADQDGGVSRRGFDLAKEALGSRAEWQPLSVYDLSPDAVGKFDFVFVGSLLLHLRDPVGALERVRGVCRGEVLVFDVVDPIRSVISRRPSALLDGRRVWWWTPNWQGLRRMIESAGLEVVERGPLTFVPGGAGRQRPGWREAARLGLLGLLAATKVSPQIGVLARPAARRASS
jgi:tRNA (mo5U34)-methyltransferase